MCKHGQDVKTEHQGAEKVDLRDTMLCVCQGQMVWFLILVFDCAIIITVLFPILFCEHSKIHFLPLK